MSTDDKNQFMRDTSIRLSEELVDELSKRKGQNKSYEAYLWELLNKVDQMDSESADRRDIALVEPNFEGQGTTETGTTPCDGANYDLRSLETVTRNKEWGNKTFRDAGEATFGNSK